MNHIEIRLTARAVFEEFRDVFLKPEVIGPIYAKILDVKTAEAKRMVDTTLSEFQTAVKEIVAIVNGTGDSADNNLDLPDFSQN